MKCIINFAIFIKNSLLHIIFIKCISISIIYSFMIDNLFPTINFF